MATNSPIDDNNTRHRQDGQSIQQLGPQTNQAVIDAALLGAAQAEADEAARLAATTHRAPLQPVNQGAGPSNQSVPAQQVSSSVYNDICSQVGSPICTQSNLDNWLKTCGPPPTQTEAAHYIRF